MATGTDADAVDLGRVSRLRGKVFATITRAASAVGVVALALLIVYVVTDAVQPTTADPEWYLLLAGTVLLPSGLLAVYGWYDRSFARVALRAIGATVGGTALAAVLVLWLGGQLGLLALAAVVLPTIAAVGVLTRRRDALGVGLQVAGIVVAGGTVATSVSLFLGAQATLVYAVALGVPAALLGRYFLARPAVGSVGAHATAAAAIGLGLASVVVEGVSSVLGVLPGDAAVGGYALGAIVGVVAYALYARAYREAGHAGLLAPFILLGGVLLGFVFHRSFVVTVPVTPVLYAVVAGVPALAYAVKTLRSGRRGAIGLGLPLVPLLGAAFALWFHAQFVVLAPTVLVCFGGAVALAWGLYAWYVFDRERPGAKGLLAPLIVGGGLLGGLLGARALDVAGPETWIDLGFLTGSSHYDPALAGIHPALVGSLYLMVIVALAAFPVGVGAAIYLEEYAPDNRWTRLLEVNIANLAGVPSVVYGLLGVAVFVRYGGLPLGALVVGGVTLALLILPIVIISAQEAIRAVPDSLRQASYGMGATRWQTVRNVVLPEAMPGILTGTILALGRAVGETAPLLMVGLAAIGGVPDGLLSQGTAMPLQVFSWALDARPLFREHVAAAGALTLLVVMLSMNGIAIIIRNRYQRDT